MKEEVEMLFEVLQGMRQLQDVLDGLPDNSALAKYAKDHDPQSWAAAKNWSAWWMRERHLST